VAASVTLNFRARIYDALCMCGVAGYSLSVRSDVDRTRAAQALLAGIAERGADAVGYAHRSAAAPVAVHKQRSGASAVLERMSIPADASQVLLHVRDYTKGHPRIAANNHPVRHGAVVGVHNGTILNDDEVMERNGFARAEPAMTVDSEVIFAVAEASGSDPLAFEQLRGSMAAAWLDERRPGLLYLARGVGRPLWVGTTRRELLFASTERALEIAERYTGLRLRKRELAEGTLLAIAGARAVRRERFTPDAAYEADPLPAVRAPHEEASCLQRLAALAAVA
jgi:glucosamine 6-phosphate synthetase-like amidotransferase/phosphosugar isomerase protein